MSSLAFTHITCELAQSKRSWEHPTRAELRVKVREVPPGAEPNVSSHARPTPSSRAYLRAGLGHMANERLAKGPEDGPDYTETNGASWMPGFTCGGREGKVEGEEAEPFGSDAEEMSSRAGFARMLSFWKLMGPLIVRYKLVRKLPKGDVRDEELERLQGQSAAWAVPQLGSCASSGRAWRLWAARHSQGRGRATGRAATASAARGSRPQSRRCHRPSPSRWRSSSRASRLHSLPPSTRADLLLTLTLALTQTLTLT